MPSHYFDAFNSMEPLLETINKAERDNGHSEDKGAFHPSLCFTHVGQRQAICDSEAL